MSSTIAKTKTPASDQPVAPRKRKASPGRIIAWIAMILIVLITLFPFYWMLRTALSTNASLYSDPGSFLPPEFSTGGFQRVFGTQSAEDAVSVLKAATDEDIARLKSLGTKDDPHKTNPYVPFDVSKI